MKKYRLKPLLLVSCPKDQSINAGSSYCTDKCEHCCDCVIEEDFSGRVDYIEFNCNFKGATELMVDALGENRADNSIESKLELNNLANKIKQENMVLKFINENYQYPVKGENSNEMWHRMGFNNALNRLLILINDKTE